jgi:hypothetical protein
MKKTNQDLLNKLNINNLNNSSSTVGNNSNINSTHGLSLNALTINPSLNLDRKYYIYFIIRMIAEKLLHKRVDSEKLNRHGDKNSKFKGKSKQNSDE